MPEPRRPFNALLSVVIALALYIGASKRGGIELLPASWLTRLLDAYPAVELIIWITATIAGTLLFVQLVLAVEQRRRRG